MRVLVACEFSGTVREAFAARGHDAWSCDILPTEQPGNHYQCDVREVLNLGWDLMVAHPPCQYLSYAGARWMNRPGRAEKMEEALEFFRLLMAAPIEKIAIENPRGWTWKNIRKPDQIVEPCHFGDPYTKATCLWLKNLPPLMASLIIVYPFKDWTVSKRGGHNGKARSKTFPGIAAAMAEQWGR